MERPPGDPAKLLASAPEWGAGEITPARVLADFQTGDRRDVLAHVAATAADGS